MLIVPFYRPLAIIKVDTRIVLQLIINNHFCSLTAPLRVRYTSSACQAAPGLLRRV